MAGRDTSLGALEHIVLLAVLRLGDEAYGITVGREIERATGRDHSTGAIYTTLLRLESKGFLTSCEGEPTAERGGRTKRYFRLTAGGRRMLRETRDLLQKMGAGIGEPGAA